jgi:hypothetical protein
VMIDRLIAAGFEASALADGSQSHLGAWALDVLWTEVHVWAGLQQHGTKLCAVPNDTYARSAGALQSYNDTQTDVNKQPSPERHLGLSRGHAQNRVTESRATESRAMHAQNRSTSLTSPAW